MAAPAPNVKAIFDHALELESPAAREAYLADACARRPRPAPESRRLVEGVCRRRQFPRDGGASRRPRAAANRRLPRQGRTRRRNHCRKIHARRTDRRRGHGLRLAGQADGTGQALRRGQAHQGRHGLQAGAGAVRGRAAGAGADGSSQHRQGARRRPARRAGRTS